MNSIILPNVYHEQRPVPDQDEHRHCVSIDISQYVGVCLCIVLWNTSGLRTGLCSRLPQETQSSKQQIDDPSKCDSHLFISPSSSQSILKDIPEPVPQKQNKVNHPSQPQQKLVSRPNPSLPMPLQHPHQRNSVVGVLARTELGEGGVRNQLRDHSLWRSTFLLSLLLIS